MTRGRLSVWRARLRRAGGNEEDDLVRIRRRGRVTKTTYPAASGQPAPFTETRYDTSGRVTTSWDERRNPTYYEYQPGTGRRTAVVNAKNERTEYTLGASGETLAVEDAKGYVTRSVYDANGRLVMTQLPQIPGEDPTSIQTFYDAPPKR